MNDYSESRSSGCDVAVVGAGAAGVGAARRLKEAGLHAVVLEARDRLGGRAHTVGTGIGRPADVGCEWLHCAKRNPWTEIARGLGFAIDETLPNWGARVAWLEGDAAQHDWMNAREAFDERCEAAAAAPEDRAESQCLEPGNRWNGLIGAISTWANGIELERVSVKDHARYESDAQNWRVLDGYGTLVSTYGAALDVRFNTVVERIDHSGRRIALATSRGDISARAAIVTVPTNLLARETIRFSPALPAKLAAAAGLPLGIANKLYLAIDGEPGDVPQDRHLVGSTQRVRTGGYHIRSHGWPMIEGYFGGTLAADLEADNGAAMLAFALDELGGLFGKDFTKRLRPVAQSRWVADPFANGSYSCALPGHAEDRLTLAEPVDDRLFFAGEACSIPFFGTAHGAYLSAVAAAERAIAALTRTGAALAAPGR
jgi:monoamine oxidase